MKKPPVYWSIALSLLLCPLARGLGDRGIDENRFYPEGAFVASADGTHVGSGRIIDVRHPPAGCTAATGDGSTDDTVALRSVMAWVADKYEQYGGWTHEFQYEIYFRNGTYKVTDTITYNDRANYTLPFPPANFLTYQASGEDGTNTKNKAFDNNTGTIWRSASTTMPQQIGLGFNYPYCIYSYTITADTAATAPKSWKFEGSTNGTTYVEIESQTLSGSGSGLLNLFTTGQTKTFVVTPAMQFDPNAATSLSNYKYFRLNVSATGTTGNKVAVREFRPNTANPYPAVAVAQWTDPTNSAKCVPIGTMEMNRIRLIGQSRAGVIIQVPANTPAFSSAASPRPVIAFHKIEKLYDNTPSSNFLRNMTVRIGANNPGAIAVRFQAANNGGISNLAFIDESTDANKALCAIDCQAGSLHAYFRDISITGFERGVRMTPQSDSWGAFEHLTLAGQDQMGMEIYWGTGIVRDLYSLNTVPAVRVTGRAGMLTLVDSNLAGGQTGVPATELVSEPGGYTGPGDNDVGVAFLRNVTVSIDYASPLRRAGSDLLTGKAYVDEYSSAGVKTLRPGQLARTFSLPVLDTPETVWPPTSEWDSPDAHGAVGDGTTDDTAAVQAAFNTAGKTVIYFPKAKYNITSTITVPATIKRIQLMHSDLNKRFVYNAAATSEPLVISDVGNTATTGLNISSARPVVMIEGAGIFNTATTNFDIFTEDTTKILTEYSANLPGMRFWARAINMEDPSITTAQYYIPGNASGGASAWIFGQKDEEHQAGVIRTNNGSTIEHLGGEFVMNTNETVRGLVENANGNVVAIMGTEQTALTNNFIKDGYVGPTENDWTYTASYDDAAFPLRDGDFPATLYDNHFLSLYVGYNSTDTNNKNWWDALPGAPSTGILKFGVFNTLAAIGTSMPTGRYSVAGDEYLVAGGGAGVAGSSDHCHFLHNAATGDTEVTARLVSIENTAMWAQAGVMLRESTAAGARFAFLCAIPPSATYPKGATAFLIRTTTNGGLTNTTTWQELPAEDVRWLRLKKVGTSFSAWRSLDGYTWVQQGTTQTISGWTTNYLAGLVSAGTAGVPAAHPVKFTNVRSGYGLFSTSADIGAAAEGSGAAGYADVYSLSGTGDAVWGTTDKLHYVYGQAGSGDSDATIITRLDSFDSGNVWAYAGPMMRDGVGNDAKFAMVAVSAAGKVTLLYRSAVGNSTVAKGGWVGPLPNVAKWLKLTRSGNNFSGYYSFDGQNWLQLGGGAQSITGLANNINVGLVSSSTDSTAGGAEFSQTSVTW